MSALHWVSAEPPRGEYLTLDSQQRIYLSSGTCALLNVSKDGQFPLYIGHDHDNRRIVIARTDVVRLTNVRPFHFDKRRYTYARAFVQGAAIAPADLPLRYEYAGKDYADAPTGSFIFELDEGQA